jgi:hypothetical protein
LITVGSKPPLSSSVATIVVVVVLPCVPGNGDVGPQPHQFRQHLGPPHHRQLAPPRLLQLRVALLDRGLEITTTAAVADVLGALALEERWRPGRPAGR